MNILTNEQKMAAKRLQNYTDEMAHEITTSAFYALQKSLEKNPIAKRFSGGCFEFAGDTAAGDMTVLVRESLMMGVKNQKPRGFLMTGKPNIPEAGQVLKSHYECGITWQITKIP